VDSLPNALETRLGSNGVTLSGGQRQRVAIARALLKNAPVLILDEATCALDSETERLVRKAIENAVIGRTSLVIAHRLSTIQRADKIVVLEGGQVSEEGTLPELLDRRGRFCEMWPCCANTPSTL
jgi:subfamily B ATP-binding cassette protein MsbA